MQSPQQVEVDGLPESCRSKARLRLASVGGKKASTLADVTLLGD